MRLNMVKRKRGRVNKESMQNNGKSKRVDDAEKHSTDPNSYMLTDTELYSNKNIKLILSHYMQDKVIGVDIFDYDVRKKKKGQWVKQQKKLIKKLKFDLCKFKSSQLTEKFYILAQQDHNAVITAASIIRFFTQDGGQQAIRIIGLIDYLCAVELFVQLNKESMSNDIDINMLSRRETLTINGEIDIGKFIEVIKLKINNIDNTVSIDEDIKKVIEVPSNSYKMAHRAIVDKHKIEFQDSEGKGRDSSEEHEVLDTIDPIRDTIEHEEIVGEVVEQPITRTVKKKKSVSWDVSVTDNEGRTRNNKQVRLYDAEAIEIFAKAVSDWDLELFKAAKDKSKNFAKVVDYFIEKIKTAFWVDFLNNMHHQYVLKNELDPNESPSTKIEEYKDFIQEISQVYVFLKRNVPSFWDMLKQEQLSYIDYYKIDWMSKDLLAIIEGKINPVKAWESLAE